MKIFKRKSFVALVIITGCVILFTIVFGNSNFLNDAVKTAFTPILTVTNKASTSIKEFQAYFTELKSYKEKNTELARELAKYKSEKSSSSYAEENKRLEELLDLKNEMEDRFSTISARIISYEPNNWFDTIVINKGKWSGVEVGDAVISTDGVIGKITEVGSGYSVISSIISTNNAIGVRIVRTGEIGVVEGDTTLMDEKLCKMSFIEKKDSVSVGDYLETTGTGGVYPSGIKVGEISEIRAVNSVQYAVVKPAAELGNVHEVLVISRGGNK